MCEIRIIKEKVAVFRRMSNGRRFEVPVVETNDGTFEIKDPSARGGWVGPFLMFKRQPALFVGLQDRFIERIA